MRRAWGGMRRMKGRNDERRIAAWNRAAIGQLSFDHASQFCEKSMKNKNKY